MTPVEYLHIMEILDDLVQEEEERCNRYCKLNPDDDQTRKKEASIYITALNIARRRIRDFQLGRR